MSSIPFYSTRKTQNWSAKRGTLLIFLTSILLQNIKELKGTLVSQAAACDGNYYQILIKGDNTNPPPGVLPI